MFEGVIPAIITPFLRNSTLDLDLDGLRSNIEFLLENGVHGIVPCGSTGESATLTFEEHEKVIEVAIEVAGGKVPVIAGTGSNNTAEAIRLTKAAKDMGADGVLVISPYYNKPNRSGLVKHYTALADQDIPVIMYNVPGRTGQNLPPDLVAELARHPDIVGIKEASGDIGQVSRIIEATLDEDFVVISGTTTSRSPSSPSGGRVSSRLPQTSNQHAWLPCSSRSAREISRKPSTCTTHSLPCSGPCSSTRTRSP